jgi:hypothetical protein
MSSDERDGTASLMTPAKLAQLRARPAASPAAWLDQLASDAGAMHLRRLEQLRDELHAQARSRDDTATARSLRALAGALERLDFTLLHQSRGLLARITGKGRGATAEFAGQYEQIVEAGEQVKAQMQALATVQQAQAGAAERILLEFEVEYGAIEKIIDQGARWLQDMRGQLKTREAAAADEAAMNQMREDAARCELLFARLKHLRLAVTAAQQTLQQAQAAAARRAALLQMLQQRLAPGLKAWEARLAPVAAGASGGGSAQPTLERPPRAQRELATHVEQAEADCAQLQLQERALAESLASLTEQLQGAAAS